MHPDYRRQLVIHLADIDQKTREVEELTAVPAHDVPRRASKVLAELKETRRDVETKLRAGSR